MRLLVLAGTREARDIAVQAAGLAGVEVRASLAGATRAPLPLGVATRKGGFGGREKFGKYLRDNLIDAIIDATHPFAARISRRTGEVAAEQHVPLLHVLRPGWRPGSGDRWLMLAREEDAAAMIPPSARVFLATGRQSLPRFAGLAGHEIICRQIDPPDGPFPFPGGRFLVGRPPFSVADEVALFRDLGIDWLVVKNAGGAASASKLVAARALGMPVAMLRRPPDPPGEIVETVGEALAWLKALL